MGMTQSKQEEPVVTPATSADTLHNEEPVVSDQDNGRDDSSSVSYDSGEEREDEEFDEEFEEYMQERLRILEDSRNLKKVAEFFLHPEKPTKADADACGRNYFARLSAPEYDDEDVADEQDLIMRDMAALKKAAIDYMHPEYPVTTDPNAYGRNYFNRPSVPEKESFYEAEQRALLLAEMGQLKKLAVDYMHPELAVTTSDPTVYGRNYFSRNAAPEQENEDEERKLIFEEMAQLKKLAVDYLHPELPVITNATVCGRNYFSRPSGLEYDDEVIADEREHIMEDVMTLKKYVVDYMHPEKPVRADPTAFARNYFTRPSASDKESFFEAEQRAFIFAEMSKLKKLAVDYMHPELPIVTSDPTVYGRNYFTRPSGDEQEDREITKESPTVLEDAEKLKKLAVDYMHPELPVDNSDPAVFGRNYFSRPSAPPGGDLEEEEEKYSILEEMAQLKQVATDYMHPELPVVALGPSVSGRNYFNRFNAPETDTDELSEERALILQEMAQLKQKAVDYLHPELPVATTNPSLFGRDYFSRPSAPAVNEFVHSVILEHDEDDELYIEHTGEPSHHDLYYHHAHFDMDDDIHVHHVDFDRNTDYHHEITEVRYATPNFVEHSFHTSKPGEDDKLSSSPECIMFGHFKHPHYVD